MKGRLRLFHGYVVAESLFAVGGTPSRPTAASAAGGLNPDAE